MFDNPFKERMIKFIYILIFLLINCTTIYAKSNYDSLFTVANNLHSIGSYEEASNIINKNLVELQEIGDKPAFVKHLIFLAEIKRAVRLYPPALRNINQAIDESLLLNDSFLISKAYNRQAAIYFEMQEDEKCLTAAEKSFEIAKKRGFEKIEFSSGIIISACKRASKNPYEAYELVLNIIKEGRKIKNFPEYIDGYMNLMHSLYQLKRFDELIQYADTALKYIYHHNARTYLPQVYLHKYNAYRQIGNYENSLYSFEKYVSTLDSIEKKNQVLRFENLNTKYDFERKAKENLYLKEKEEKAKALGYIYLLLLCFLIVICLIIFIAYRRSKQKEKHIKEQHAEIVRQKQTVEDLNNKLKESNIELANVNKVKDKIFSVVAHDLRNPLGNLSSVLQLAVDDELPPDELERVLKKLKIETDSINLLLNSLLSWSKAQLNGLDPKIEKHSLKPIIESSINEVSHLFKDKGLEIWFDSSDVQVLADVELLNIVFRNLLTNALKFTKKGGVKVFIKIEKDLAKIYFEDTGLGIGKNEIKDLFTLSGKTTYGTNNEKGTGLGLPMCKQFVEIQNGEISVESQIGVGSIFCVTLPLAK